MKKDKIIGHKTVVFAAKCKVYFSLHVHFSLYMYYSLQLYSIGNQLFFTVNIINFKCAYTCTCV